MLAAFFAATIEHPTPTRLAELAIQSAQDRTVRLGRDGISYLIEAKRCGLVTPLSPYYEREILRITGNGDARGSTCEAYREMISRNVGGS